MLCVTPYKLPASFLSLIEEKEGRDGGTCILCKYILRYGGRRIGHAWLCVPNVKDILLFMHAYVLSKKK